MAPLLLEFNIYWSSIQSQMFELAVSVDPATGDAEEMEGINTEPTRDLQVGCLTLRHFYTTLHMREIRNSAQWIFSVFNSLLLLGWEGRGNQIP